MARPKIHESAAACTGLYRRRRIETKNQRRLDLYLSPEASRILDRLERIHGSATAVVEHLFTHFKPPS